MINIPSVVVVWVEEQRFTTLGDWWEEAPGRFVITVSRMPDWRYEFLVLVHELTEWAMCQAAGVSTEDCDAFDALWEKELATGLHRVEVEAGFDRRCPYRKGHVWGTRMERVFAFLLRVRWREYCGVCDEMMRMRPVHLRNLGMAT